MKKHTEAEFDERGYLLNIRDLKLSYRQTYWQLKRSLKAAQSVTRDENGNIAEHPDIKTLKGAASDVNFAIQWMHTGRRPGNRRGIERRAAYQREKLMDPILMQSFVANSTSGSPANLSDFERFEIEDALSRLTEQQRACYEMVHGQGYSYAHAASILGISKGAVQISVNRAQKKISEDVNCTLVLKSIDE